MYSKPATLLAILQGMKHQGRSTKLVFTGLLGLALTACGSGSKIEGDDGDRSPLPLTGARITVSAPSTLGPVNSGRLVYFSVTYSDEREFTFGLNESHIELHTTGNAICDVVMGGTGGNSKNLHLQNCTGSGTVAISVQGESATDQDGQSFPDSGMSQSFAVINGGSFVTIDSTGLGASPSRDPAARTITLAGEGIVSYKARRIQATSCEGVDFTSAIARSIDLPFSFNPERNIGPNIVCAIGLDTYGNWQTVPSASALLVVDTIAPVISIEGELVRGPVSATDIIDFTITFTGADEINFTTGDLRFLARTGDTAECQFTVVGTAPTSYILRISQCTGNGLVSFWVNEGVATDFAGNQSSNSNGMNIIVENL